MQVQMVMGLGKGRKVRLTEATCTRYWNDGTGAAHAKQESESQPSRRHWSQVNNRGWDTKSRCLCWFLVLLFNARNGPGKGVRKHQYGGKIWEVPKWKSCGKQRFSERLDFFFSFNFFVSPFFFFFASWFVSPWIHCRGRQFGSALGRGKVIQFKDWK